jgi:hypothetical protein
LNPPSHPRHALLARPVVSHNRACPSTARSPNGTFGLGPSNSRRARRRRQECRSCLSGSNQRATEKQPKSDRTEGAGPYEGLRSTALSAVANGLQSPTDDHPDVSGLVVDIPVQEGFAAVVALTDNTTSMYTSVGGGTIGAGEHQNVASATQALLSSAQAQHCQTRLEEAGATVIGSFRRAMHPCATPLPPARPPSPSLRSPG